MCLCSRAWLPGFPAELLQELVCSAGSPSSWRRLDVESRERCPGQARGVRQGSALGPQVARFKGWVRRRICGRELRVRA